MKMKTKTRLEKIAEFRFPSSLFHPPSSLLTALLLAGLGFIASAENLGNYVITDFSAVLENHKAPYETQMKSLLQGAEAEPQSGGQTLIRSLKLKTFSETGELQMLVQAPECVFATLRDSNSVGAVHYTVSSGGHLTAQSGDGRFVFEGEGFLWQQTNNVLIISNRVQTVIQSEPKKASKK